jgi:DNA-binding HxlR family transcriptional regulator
MILSTRLKELETEKLVTKIVNTNSFPIKCEYSLTKSGEGFMHIIKDIKRWALVWKFDNRLCTQAECANCKL